MYVTQCDEKNESLEEKISMFIFITLNRTILHRVGY